MGIASDTKLIVKHTFLEFVQQDPLHKDLRARAQTDSTLVCGLPERDALSLDSVLTSVDNERSPIEHSSSSEALHAQYKCPVVTVPTNAQGDSTCPPVYYVAETVVPWMPCYDDSAWVSGDAWWMPASYITHVPHGAPAADVQHDATTWEMCDQDSPDGSSSAEDFQTTVMLRNLPNNYTREMLLELIDSEGFIRKYDFVYLPIDFNSQAGLGYAFVDLITPAVARRFWQHFEGFARWGMPSDKVCTLNWSAPHQGLAAHIERYRNSPVMHEAVSDECKPMLFSDGMRIPFPPPTKELKAPRLRARASVKPSYR